MQFAVNNAMLIIGLIGGAIVTLTLEHGWGWVLAQVKARKARLAFEAQQTLSKVDRTIAVFRSELDRMGADIADLKSKVGQ